MKNKTVTGNCNECDSAYDVQFVEELTSQELPEFCPFCGESIDDLSEEYIEDDDIMDEENSEWE
jgi:5'-3' exonuclease